jgi:Co/Zn/Cd efflux system component
MVDTVYYELSWSILSTIGIANVLFGLMVAGITSFGPVSIVPIVTSAAGAIANGLCYYAFYDKENSATTQAVASVFADILWLVGMLCIFLQCFTNEFWCCRYKRLACHSTVISS